MFHPFTVICPHCKSEDTTSIEIDTFDYPTLIATQCETCAMPYALQLSVRFDIRTATIDLS